MRWMWLNAVLVFLPVTQHWRPAIQKIFTAWNVACHPRFGTPTQIFVLLGVALSCAWYNQLHCRLFALVAHRLVQGFRLHACWTTFGIGIAFWLIVYVFFRHTQSFGSLFTGRTYKIFFNASSNDTLDSFGRINGASELLFGSITGSNTAFGIEPNGACLWTGSQAPNEASGVEFGEVAILGTRWRTSAGSLSDTNIVSSSSKLTSTFSVARMVVGVTLGPSSSPLRSACHARCIWFVPHTISDHRIDACIWTNCLATLFDIEIGFWRRLEVSADLGVIRFYSTASVGVINNFKTRNV